VNTRERYKEGGNISLKNPSSWRRRRKKREKKKLAPYKIYSLWLDLDLEKKEASDSLYCIRRRNHIARSRSREEGNNLK
jgi:hypothetical protein